MTSDHEDADADKLLDFKKAIHDVRRKREARSAQVTSGTVNDAIVPVSEKLPILLRYSDTSTAEHGCRHNL